MKFSRFFLVFLLHCVPKTETPIQQASTPPVSDPVQPTAPTGPTGPAIQPEALDYFIVSADALTATAEKWRDYRKQQGLRASFVSVSEIAKEASSKQEAVDAITARIASEATRKGAGKPFFVLILGDAEGSKFTGAFVPDATYKSGGETVSTDNWYADLDEDDMPDLAIGRVAVRTTAEAEVVLSKTISYESDYAPGEWNRRASVFASEAGFSPQQDQLIENMVFQIVEDLPYEYDFSMTYAKQTSPYVFVPEQFSDKVYDRMNEGALLVTYVGHGSTDSFTTLSWNSKSFEIMDTAKLSKLNVQHRPPILSFIACLTGGFSSGESLSERIVKQPGAPVAVLSSTEISNPLPNAIFIRELGQAILGEKKATLGEAFVRAKQRLVKQKDALRTQIGTIASLMYSAAEMQALQTSHLHMYTLFGDPALKLSRPSGKLTITAPAKVTHGTTFNVSVVIEGLGAGDAVVTLETKRSTIAGTIAAVPNDGSGHRDAVIAANYAVANDKRVVTKSAPHNGASLSTSLLVPAGAAAGEYYLKIFAKDGSADAIGFAKIVVE